MKENRIIPGLRKLIEAEAAVRARVALEPKPANHSTQNSMPLPKSEKLTKELREWQRAHAEEVRYMGQPTRQ